MDQDFSGSCTATSRNSLIQRGATTATKSEPFRPQRGAPGSIVKDLPLRREAACYSELPRIPLPRTWVNKPPADVPEAARWHHVWCRPGRESRVGKRRGGSSCVGRREEQSSCPPVLRGGVGQGQPSRSGRFHRRRLRGTPSSFRPVAWFRGLKAAERRLPVGLPRPEGHSRGHLRRR